MSDANMIPALIMAAGMATAGSLAFDESPAAVVQSAAAEVDGVALNGSHRQPIQAREGKGGFALKLDRMGAWLKG